MSNKTYKIEDVYCIMPFYAFSSDGSGNRRLCCNGKQEILRDNGEPYHILDSDIDESLNSSTLKDIRRYILNGKRHPICQQCWFDEDHGGFSIRQALTENLERAGKTIESSIKEVHSDGTMDGNEWIYLDLTLGNICDLKCKMCNERNSHKIYEEMIERNLHTSGEIYDWFRNSSLTDQLLPYLNSCYEIHFLGGEPLITKEHDRIVEKIIELGREDQVRLLYNSNMNNLPKRILNYWGKFDHIQCGVSIDGFEEVDEYIRFGTKWERKLNNIYKLKGYDNITIDFHITVQALNLLSIPDLLMWILNESDDLSDEGNRWYIKCPFLNYVTHHDQLDPKVLPYDIKQKSFEKLKPVLEKYRSYGIPKMDQYATWLENLYTEILNEDKSNLWPNFMDYIKSQDEFRYKDKNKILNIYPELTPYW